MASPELAWNQTFGIRATIFLCGGVFGFLLSLGLQKHSYESGFEDGFWICVSGLDEVAQSEHKLDRSSSISRFDGPPD